MARFDEIMRYEPTRYLISHFHLDRKKCRQTSNHWISHFSAKMTETDWYPEKVRKISSISRKFFAESFGMNLPSDGSPQVLAFSASFCVTKQNFQFRFRLCFEGQLFQLDPIFCGARAKELAGVHEKGFEIKSSMSKQIRSWNYLKNDSLENQNWVIQNN